jgi:hypothetical protein
MRIKLTQEIAAQIAKENGLRMSKQSISNCYDWYKPYDMYKGQFICSEGNIIDYLYKNNMVDTNKYKRPWGTQEEMKEDAAIDELEEKGK